MLEEVGCSLAENFFREPLAQEPFPCRCRHGPERPAPRAEPAAVQQDRQTPVPPGAVEKTCPGDGDAVWKEPAWSSGGAPRRP